jgi:hypothetical protein
LPREFVDLGGEDPILRALRELVGEGSSQVPVNTVVRVKGRFAGQLGYRGNTLALERSRELTTLPRFSPRRNTSDSRDRRRLKRIGIFFAQ